MLVARCSSQATWDYPRGKSLKGKFTFFCMENCFVERNWNWKVSVLWQLGHRAQKKGLFSCFVMPYGWMSWVIASRICIFVHFINTILHNLYIKQRELPSDVLMVFLLIQHVYLYFILVLYISVLFCMYYFSVVCRFFCF